MESIRFKKIKSNYFLLFIIFSPILLDFVISMIYKTALHAPQEPLLFMILTISFLNPISEEFLARGLIIGMIALIPRIFNTNKVVTILFYIFALLISSYSFTIGHINITQIQFVSRYVASLLFGFLYLTSNRNITVPIVAHASENLFLIIKDIFLG